METGNSVNLGELRREKPTFSEWCHKHLAFLFNGFSLFYFFLFIFALGLGWMGYSLIANSGTQLYGWDYQSQYVTMAYNFWDTWRNFFKTGVFQLYGTATYLGTDNIGSNSYYGLFDPFLAVCYLFPRSWIPQTFALATVFKGVAGAAAMRAYLKYLGCSERSSRLGAVAFAFSGYVTFMEGFPSFVSMAFCVPLVMFGIDRVLKERKPAALVFGLFLLGMISFFFLVVVCIWGVIYAIWRYFWTLKTRSAKENVSAVFVGIFAFAVGILMAGWTLFPSLRESSLSGRTVSIGSAYLASLKTAFLDFDFQTIFARLFEMVGDNPGRELQGLVSFFYPTCNYLYSPLYKSSGQYSYDSWTASLFCYTPIVVLFFIALVDSIRGKKWSHLIAFALCAYLVFTDFAYFFFYAFTGDGYGRWYIVLVPLIIYYACQEFDRIGKEKKWVVASGSLAALALTILTWVLCIVVLSGKTFTVTDAGPYYQSNYLVPAYYVVDGITYSLLWEIYYEIALDVAVAIVILVFQHKDWLWKILIGFVSVETIVMGNLSFIYGYSSVGNIWPYDTSYNGGSTFSSEATQVWDYVDSFDGDSYYRAYMDGLPDSNSQEAFGYNGSSCFHSLLNFDLAQLTRYSHMTGGETSGKKFGYTYCGKSWSGYYGNKRFAFDQALSMKYYAIENEGYGNCEANKYDADNVPFGSTLVYGDASTPFRVYENPYVEEVSLGHAIDHLYLAQSNPTPGNPDTDAFYDGSSGALELIRNEETYLDGAIIGDSDGDKIQNEGLGLSVESTPSAGFASIHVAPVSYSSAVYTNTYDWWGPYDSSTGNHAGPAYFLTDSDTTIDTTPGILYTADKDKLVFTSKTGTYFNTNDSGAYFLMQYPSPEKTRICFVGDRFNADGTVAASNVLLTYEYHSIASYLDRKVGDGGNLFGFYPEGRVKYIFFCAKNSDLAQSITSYPTIYMCERSVLENEMAKLSSSDYNLTNVKYSTDRLTFGSDYSKKRLVVTSLGYDAGWKVTATDAAGNVTYPSVYRLDGGFVGFIAPAGSVTYVMTYETPYLRVGVEGAIISFAAFALYEGLYFYRSLRKEEAALSVEGSGGKPKKKKEEPGSSEGKPTS